MQEAVSLTTGKPNQERTRALGLLLLAAFLWSLGGALIKVVHWHPMAIAGMRSAIAAVLIRVVFRRMSFTWSFYQVGGAGPPASTSAPIGAPFSVAPPPSDAA